MDLPLEKQSILAKWVFKVKQKTKGWEPMFKARLITRGFEQKGMDYEETFSLVAK